MWIRKKSGKKNATNIFQAFIIDLTSNYWFIYLALSGSDIVSNNTTSNILIIKNAWVENFTEGNY